MLQSITSLGLQFILEEGARNNRINVNSLLDVLDWLSEMVEYFNSVLRSYGGGWGVRGGVRKHKRRVIYLTDYEKSFPIASERRHRKPISLAAAFGVCVIHPLVLDDCHPLYVRLDPRGGGGGSKARKDSRRSAIYSRVDFPGHPLASKEVSSSSSLPLTASLFSFAKYSLNKISK